jgi:glycosyltransferase involved in cell wall biosynthesis
VLYRGADGVLANSGREPFGLVGLEAMAAGGVAYAGRTGEDYAIPFVNALVLETSNPLELVSYATYLREFPEEGVRLWTAAKGTARQFK